MSDTKTELIKSKYSGMSASIDDYLTRISLDRTVGELMQLHETATNARAYFVAHLVYNAIFEQDIAAINQIIFRIDGSIPEARKREGYANIFGDALEDVLDYDNVRELRVYPQDTCIIALAKVVVYISLTDPGKNYQKKKDKDLAIEIVLSRTGGKKSEPTKALEGELFVNPDWMGLPGGNDEDQ